MKHFNNKTILYNNYLNKLILFNNNLIESTSYQ